ncbi:MAG: trypsin-like peptidase domain-containing protein [Gammaproteobacteria bacterium]|nr:trypsin-like peptidase domain-containing protein [Gammaproteobacteria bacterium]MYE30393.1 trypsin-like peptidase domain-containing protein [Gammaproteobacteria bacterium]
MNNKGEHKVRGFFDTLSGVSRYIRMYFGETFLASGTCFFVMTTDGPVLVTNRHNFTGRDNITGRPLRKDCGIPDHAVVTLHGPGEVHYHIDLVDRENPEAPSWVEHPTLGAEADIVALPVKEMTNIIGETNSISLEGVSSQANWHRWDVGSELQVIGYPYGQIGGPFPIWSKGFIASEPDVDVAGLPIFLIDCRSRPGQSGSPVWARFGKGDVVTHKGQDYQAKETQNYFLGVYSGRLRGDSDLGLVWKRNCIEELVNHAIAHGTQHRMELRRHRFSATFSGEFSLDRFVSDDFEAVE